MHMRAWTLHELIAPSIVIVLSRDRKVVAHKVALTPLLQKVTSVFSCVLTREASHSTASTSERMSWAKNWGTIRVEDEGYCLMGLFNVDVPTRVLQWLAKPPLEWMRIHLLEQHKQYSER